MINTEQLLEEVERLKVEIVRLNKELVNAFICGFNDGEGCIQISKPPICQLLSTLTNTNLEILIKMKHVFGGNIHVTGKDVIDRKDKWQWQISDRDTLKIFLETILPYSTVKRQQIIYALKYLELSTNCHNKGISQEELKLRGFFYDKLKEMKDVEYTKEELKIFEDKIISLNTDTNQPSLMDY